MTFDFWNIRASYTPKPQVSPNLAWLDLSVYHCGPLGEATRYHTAHDVFLNQPHSNIKPGFGTPHLCQVIARARSLYE